MSERAIGVFEYANLQCTRKPMSAASQQCYWMYTGHMNPASVATSVSRSWSTAVDRHSYPLRSEAMPATAQLDPEDERHLRMVSESGREIYHLDKQLVRLAITYSLCLIDGASTY